MSTPSVDVGGYPPYVEISEIKNPKLADVPALEKFQVLEDGERMVKNWHIRVQKPKFPLPAFLIGLIFYILPAIGILIWHFFFRKRGHTFLYLTTKRLIIVELAKGMFGKDQTILNYNIEHISGFGLYTQRGVQKLLNLIPVKEKRTFLIEIHTRSVAYFALGGRNTLKSDFEPGKDAVALCAELDGTLLAVRSGTLGGA